MSYFRSVVDMDINLGTLLETQTHPPTHPHTHTHTHTHTESLRQSIDFVEPEYSLLCSDVPAGGSYPVWGELVYRFTPHFKIFMLCYLRLCFPVVWICRHTFALPIIINPLEPELFFFNFNTPCI